MLLRRITKHVKTQNWFAIFIDFIIVVVGVFIGIQVANWNAERDNDALEKEYINRLFNDFQGIDKRLTGNIEFFNKSIEANQYLTQLITSQVLPDSSIDDEIKRALRLMFGSRIPGWQSTTYLEMQSAGDINLLDSVDLKTALREFSQTTEIAHKGWQVLINERTLLNGEFDRFATYSSNGNANDGTSSYKVSSFDFTGILESDSYRTNLNSMFRIQLNSQELQIIQLEKGQTVLEALQLEMKK